MGFDPHDYFHSTALYQIDPCNPRLINEVTNDMAHFFVYSTNEGAVALQHGEEIILGPYQTDRANYITGSVFSDKAGTLFIDQSFDYRLNLTTQPATEEGHWDISSEYAITASTGKGFQEAVVAPNIRVRFKNTSSENETILRLFARTFVTGSQ